MSRDERRLSENELRQVLQRAMEFDEGRGHRTVDVQEIASELGITEDSLQKALGELHAASPARVAAPTSIAGNPIVTGLIGTSLGVVLRISGYDFQSIAVPHWQPVLFVLGAQAIATLVAMSMEGKGRHKQFQIANVLLWVGFLLGWITIDGAAADRLPLFLSYFAAATGALGSVAILVRDWFRSFRTSTDDKSGHLLSSDATSKSWKLRIMETLASQLKQWHQSFHRLPDVFSSNVSRGVRSV